MNNEKIEEILQRVSTRFNSGYNCAESVYVAGGEVIDKEAAPSVMTGFGGGLARHNSVCGAVTGAVAAIGLHCGRTDGADRETKDKVYALVSQFIAQFRDEFGSLTCTELCGCDLSTPEGVQTFVGNDTHRQVCTRFVTGAVQIIADMLD
jgi:C_GCAxxG_C_C family probable redox protein